MIMKKWTFLAVAGLLAGAAPVFTGCIDNDEPEGISILRGAKAELLKAKATVAEAEAAYKYAQATYQEALARHEAANAAYREAEARKMEAEAARKEAETEADKAYYDKLIQQYQQEMKESAVKHQTEMIRLQALQAEMQRNYELVLKEIEIAKAVVSEEARVKISELEEILQDAYAVLYGGEKSDGTTVTVEESKARKLYLAQENLYNATLEASNGFVTTQGAKSFVNQLKLNVEVAQADVDAAEEALADLQAFRDQDAESADWVAQIKALEEKIEDLKVQVKEAEYKEDQAKNSDSYVAAAQGVYGVHKDGTLIDKEADADSKDADIISDGAYQIKNDAKEELDSEKKDTKLTFEEYSAETEVTDAMAGRMALVDGVTAPAGVSVSNWKDAFKYNKFDYYYYDLANSKALDIKDGYPTDVKNAMAYLKYLSDVVAKAAADPDVVEMAKVLKEGYEAEAKELQEDFNDAKKNIWDVAVSVMKGADVAPQAAIDQFTTNIKKYNTAYDALATAVSSYNTAWAAAYDKAYDAYIDEQENNFKYNEGVQNANYSSVNNFNSTGFKTQWAQYMQNTPEMANDANLQQMISLYCSGTDAEKATAQTAAYNAIVSYTATNFKVNTAMETVADEKGKTEANKTSMSTVTENTTALATEYNKISGYITGFTDALSYPYLQQSTKEAAKLLDAQALVAGGDASKFNSVWYTTKVDKGYTVLSVNNSKVSDELIAKATDTELQDVDMDAKERNLAQANLEVYGWSAASFTAYDPTKEADRAVIMDKNANPAAIAYTWSNKLEQIAEQDEIIACDDDLKTLSDELVADYAALDKQLQADYEEAFGELIAAYDAAVAKYDEAVEKLETEKEAIYEFTVEVAKLNAQVKAQETLLGTVIDAVETYLPSYSTGTQVPGGSDDYEGLLKKLDEAIEAQKQLIVSAEYTLSEAKVALEKAEDGEFDLVTYYEFLLNIASQEYEAASKAYQKALTNLDTALEIMADNAAE